MSTSELQFATGNPPEPHTLAAIRGITSPCELWLGYVNEYGYGRMIHDGQRMMAHQFGLFIVGGQERIAGLQIDHLCEVTTCCNPEHLEQVTQAENIKRARESERRRHGYTDQCAVDGCARPYAARGWCKKHYSRWQSNGNPLIVMPCGPKPNLTGCSEDGCERKHLAKGRCQLHYNRWKYATDPKFREDQKARSRRQYAKTVAA